MRRELEVGLAGVKCRKCVLIANVLALDQSYSVRIVCRAQRAGRGLGQSEVPTVLSDRSPVGHIDRVSLEMRLLAALCSLPSFLPSFQV